jgi:hypothetical protein
MTFYRFNRVKKKLGGLSGLMKWRTGTTKIIIAPLTGLVVLMTGGGALAEEPVPVGLRGAADGTGPSLLVAATISRELLPATQM